MNAAPALARMGDHLTEHFAYLEKVSEMASVSAVATEQSTIRTVVLLGLLTLGAVGTR